MRRLAADNPEGAPFGGDAATSGTEILEVVPDGTVGDPAAILLDDDADQNAATGGQMRWSVSAGHFWLRGGRLRVTVPLVALAHAERRLSARCARRRGRRL